MVLLYYRPLALNQEGGYHAGVYTVKGGNIFSSKMRTGCKEVGRRDRGGSREARKDLENAFTFGHHRKSQEDNPNRSNPQFQLASERSTLIYRQRHNHNNYNHLHNQREHQRNDVAMNVDKENQLLKRFEDYERRFPLGKPIKSETVQEASQSIIRPLQEEMNAMWKRETGDSGGTYNPSIEDIKRKYGYYEKEAPKEILVERKRLNQTVSEDLDNRSSKTLGSGKNRDRSPTLRADRQNELRQGGGCENRPPLRSFEKTANRTGRFGVPEEQPNKDWMLKSISDLDTRINQKFQKIMETVKANKTKQHYF